MLLLLLLELPLPLLPRRCCHRTRDVLSRSQRSAILATRTDQETIFLHVVTLYIGPEGLTDTSAAAPLLGSKCYYSFLYAASSSRINNNNNSNRTALHCLPVHTQGVERIGQSAVRIRRRYVLLWSMVCRPTTHHNRSLYANVTESD